LEQSEVETLVEELELRVERLRALYDQYFMGIEKLEPAVPRKDVDRRLFVLRRIQIRNTSLRFRFQNVLLRFNTYQTYWMRICRQIEEGTYKRDVRRANARFSAKGRREEAARETEAKGEVARDTEPPPRNVLDELEELAGEAIDVDFDTGDDGPNSDWLEELQMKAVLRPGGLPKERIPSPPRHAGPESAPQTQKPANNLEIPTEREIWIGKKPNQAVVAASPVQAETGRSAPSSPPPTLPLVLPTAKSPPAKPPPVNSPPQAAGPVGGVRYAQAGKKTASEMPSVAAAAARPSPKPAPAPVPAPEAPPTARTGQASAPRGSSPPKRKSRPSFAKIDVAKAPRAAAPSPAASKPVKDGHLSDERVRQIYTQYVDTKRSLKESTASLTYESLSKSLRDSSDMLRKKHGGKSVDFEVTVKDGKTVLRPVVK
jgi:hypothetical protein